MMCGRGGRLCGLTSLSDTVHVSDLEASQEEKETQCV